MLTSDETKDLTDNLSKMDNESVKRAIAYITWAETISPEYWKNQLGDDYNQQRVTDIKNFLWNDATKRGISVADVQAEIKTISQGDAVANIRHLKEDAIFKAISKKKSTNKIIKNVLIVVVVVVAFVLIYKFLIKGKLNLA